jgi:hypothetical protein
MTLYVRAPQGHRCSLSAAADRLRMGHLMESAGVGQFFSSEMAATNAYSVDAADL